jgi:aminoglycoside 6-adenylyltransferase
VDLVLVVEEPDCYVASNDWLSAFGGVVSVNDEQWGPILCSKRVFYDNELEVEFGITTTAWTRTDPVDPGTRQVVADGVRILYDPGGLLGRLENAIAQLADIEAGLAELAAGDLATPEEVEAMFERLTTPAALEQARTRVAEDAVMRIDTLLQTIVAWGEEQDAIRAMLLTGSLGAAAGDADEHSDLDIAMFVTDSVRYTDTDTWIHQIAGVWVYLALANEESSGPPTRLVIFDGGRKVDFSIIPIEWFERELCGPTLSDLYNRGYRILLDKDGRCARATAPAGRPAPVAAPSEPAFRAMVNEFWFEAYHVPKYLHREELWLVKQREWSTRGLLRQMIEWHARAMHGWDHDTYFLGKHMRQWADPDVWQALRDCFSRFDRADGWHAFFATIALFDRLAGETAGQLGYAYSRETGEHIAAFASDLHDAGQGTRQGEPT